MAGQVEGYQINDVLRLVHDMNENGNVQLSILARAFVTACKSCKVTKENALAHIGVIFDEETRLVPLYKPDL